MFSVQMWHPINYPSWIHRDRYVAQVNRWYLEQCLKATHATLTSERQRF
jgi:hypothetical protein